MPRVSALAGATMLALPTAVYELRSRSWAEVYMSRLHEIFFLQSQLLAVYQVWTGAKYGLQALAIA